MAREIGHTPSAVQRVWTAFGLQPHRSETFKLPSDLPFVEKARQAAYGSDLGPLDACRGPNHARGAPGLPAFPRGGDIHLPDRRRAIGVQRDKSGCVAPPKESATSILSWLMSSMPSTDLRR